MQPFYKGFLFLKCIKQIKSDVNYHILYKIVESYIKNDEVYYKLHCSYTKIVLDMTIHEIVFDLDILYGLHPIQGCFIGIEYAKIIRGTLGALKHKNKQQNTTTKYSISRYGSNNLLYQDRKGFLGFECKNSGESFIMDPRDIALSKKLIDEFDTTQSFFIGVQAGLKLISPRNSTPIHDSKKKINHLKLVTLLS